MSPPSGSRARSHRRATGWSRPTAGCSPTATRPSRAPTAARRSTPRSCGMAATADGNGYWLVAADGGVFAYGDAAFEGSHGGSPLNAPIVAMAATAGRQRLLAGGGRRRGVRLRRRRPSRAPTAARRSTGRSSAWPRPRTATATGWCAADGGVFAYGDAGLRGLPRRLAAQPADRRHGRDTRTATATGWCAADGGVFAYGDAAFEGSHGGSPLNAPICGMAATADGNGYWLVAADGGVFAYGDAAFAGSHGGSPAQPADRRHRPRPAARSPDRRTAMLSRFRTRLVSLGADGGRGVGRPFLGRSRRPRPLQGCRRGRRDGRSGLRDRHRPGRAGGRMRARPLERQRLRGPVRVHRAGEPGRTDLRPERTPLFDRGGPCHRLRPTGGERLRLLVVLARCDRHLGLRERRRLRGRGNRGTSKAGGTRIPGRRTRATPHPPRHPTTPRSARSRHHRRRARPPPRRRRRPRVAPRPAARSRATRRRMRRPQARR